MKSTIGAKDYLTPNAKVAFTQFRKVFTKTPIFCHFVLECHIRMKTNVFGYAIDGVLN